MASLVDKSTNFKDFKGFQPAADHLPEGVKKYVSVEMIPDYIDFIQNRLARESVSYIEKLVKEGREGVVVGRVTDKPFFVTDKHMGINGADGGAYALVKPGKKGKPLRLIIAHTDVPCLKVKPQPIHIQTDADNCLAYPSFCFSTEPYGGVRAEDWIGMGVDVVGSIFQNGKERRISIPGTIKQKSVHVDNDPDAKKTLNMLKVDTGIRTMKGVYKKFGIKDSMDFGRAELYVVPDFFSGINGKMVGNELRGYGHDDRSCLWTSTMAGLEAICEEDNENTFLIFGLDREEVGSTGSAGGYHGFFETVLKETLNTVYGKQADKFNLAVDLQRGLLGGYPVISADTDVALGDQEIEDIDEGLIDLQNSAKSGWGVYVAVNNVNFENRNVSPRHVDLLMSLFDKKFGKHKRDRYQIIGNCGTPDSEIPKGTMSDIFDKSFPCVDMGVPIIGLHNPTSESMNVFDMYWAMEAYAAYLGA
tara:strand:+ start:4776 stop:6200 length:1425 start_codon:yes stop_codon:yes gene_type:complete